ncbi:mechanosensitive ion channel family protein [uncultured Ilyobacter sp.]|uniref:mechanosensitive ion channel family protein n=1 Tax=uncultured Ilyobacter sp. TaxID=544433 RepID=UPI0029BFDD43|nr:mechanosensitive ion channel family protein [uncultured Ilyobacter sp.]
MVADTFLEIFSKEIILNLIIRTLIFSAVVMLTLFFVKISRKVMDSNHKLKELDPTQFTFIKHFLAGIIYFIGLLSAVYTIPSFRSLVVSIFAGSGVLAIIIGFASQQAFSNIVSGIFIAIFKPFRIGDRVKLIGKETFGMIEDITLRHTMIRTFENKRIIIPNSVISNEIIENSNIVEDKVCNHLEIGISYDSDEDKAIQIIREEAMKHPSFFDNRTFEEINAGDPSVNVRVVGFGDSSVNLKAWVWSRDSASGFVMKCDLNKSIKQRFDSEGIEIPFPYRTIVFKKDEEQNKNTGESEN